MARRFDLRIDQGQTWECVIPVYDAAGAPVDLTGSTVRGQIRAVNGGSTALHTWDAIEENVELGLGSITLRVPAFVSTDWSWRSGLWDVELTDPTGAVTRLVEGVVWVNPEVTR